MNIMKKTFLLILILFCISKISLSQTEWAPVGAKWHYSLTYATSYQEDFNVLESTKDTIVNARNCKKIVKFATTCDDRPQTEFMYEDSNRVYFYDEYSNKFNLLYDFNKTTGESWNIPVNFNSNYDSLLVHVDSTSTVIINNLSSG